MLNPRMPRDQMWTAIAARRYTVVLAGVEYPARVPASTIEAVTTAPEKG